MFEQELIKIDKIIGNNVLLAKYIAEGTAPIISGHIDGIYTTAQVKEALNYIIVNLPKKLAK